jgi:hypothetical protein
MATATAPGETLRKKAEVRAAVDLPGVPAGTHGAVFMVTGLTWTRYWVRFANGVERGTLDRRVLVTPDEWTEAERRRDAGEDTPAAAAEGADAGAAADGDGPPAAAEGVTVGGVTIPAHLLERSKSRREALGK